MFYNKVSIPGVNHILAVAVLFGIVTIVLAPIIWETGSQISSRTVTISDVVDRSRERAGQIILPTHIQQQQQDGTASIYVSNIGIEDVLIHTVLIDGIESDFVLYDQDQSPTDTLPANHLGILEVTGTGDKVQIITTIGKFFEYDLT